MYAPLYVHEIKPLEEMVEEAPHILVVRPLIGAKIFEILQVEDELHAEALAQLLIRLGFLILKNLLVLLLVCLPSHDQPWKGSPAEVDENVT